MIKKLLVCAAYIALGSAVSKKSGAKVIVFFKNEESPVLLEQRVVGGLFGNLLGGWHIGSLLQASQDTETQEDLIIEQVILPLAENLDNLNALEGSEPETEQEEKEDLENLLDTLLNLRDNLEDLEGLESLVNENFDVQQPTALLQEPQAGIPLGDLISKVVNPIINNLGQLFGKQATPVLLEQSGVPMSLNDLLSKVINPLIDNLSGLLGQKATPSFLENKKRMIDRVLI